MAYWAHELCGPEYQGEREWGCYRPIGRHKMNKESPLINGLLVHQISFKRT